MSELDNKGLCPAPILEFPGLHLLVGNTVNGYMCGQWAKIMNLAGPMGVLPDTMMTPNKEQLDKALDACFVTIKWNPNTKVVTGTKSIEFIDMCIAKGKELGTTVFVHYTHWSHGRYKKSGWEWLVYKAT